ncbi:MAG: hypothetical protein U5N86_08065 [Planctomycetota bacterium]|nr:hypothetical protein [Planctomycetota bacterium]
MPENAWSGVTEFSVFIDANSDRVAQSEEVLYKRLAVSQPITDTGTVFTPLGKLSVVGGGNVELSVQITFDSMSLDSAQLTLEEVFYSVQEDIGTVWHTPLAPRTVGYGLKVVNSADEGGSLALTRGVSLTVGTPKFISGGDVSLNLACLVSGQVESLRVERLQFDNISSFDMQSSLVNSLRVVADDGDSVYEPGSDIGISGRFEFDGLSRFYFYPDDFYLFPSQVRYILLVANFSPDVPDDTTLRIDLQPSGCEVSGI